MIAAFPMPRLIAVLFLLCSALLCRAAAADPPARVGRLSYLAGPVSLAPAGLPDEWSGAVLNRPVTGGDRLWTDRDARAEIQLGPDALRLGPDTSLDVLELDDSTLQLSLPQGTLHLRLRRVARDERIEIDTPAAALTLQQAGDYRIDVDPASGATTIAVRSGALDAASSAAAVAIDEGQSVTLYADAADYQAADLPPPDAFDRFCRERDRRAERARAAQYVAPGMTGYQDLDAYGSWRTLQNYGPVWFPENVDESWTPYRDGRWMWIEPWGWTWVDAQPWGFAPFHYGRWIRDGRRWCWYPGPRRGRPYYAPALVVFVNGGGPAGPAPLVGWIPLGYHEPYVPWYAASPAYVRGLNPALPPASVDSARRARHGAGLNYAHRAALTAVAGSVFAHGAAVRPAALPPPQAAGLVRAPASTGSAPAAPAASSIAGRPAQLRPPTHLQRRPVVALSAPPRPAPSAAPPVRVIQPPQARIGRPQSRPPAAEAPRGAAAVAPPATPPPAPAPPRHAAPPHAAPAVPPAPRAAAPFRTPGPAAAAPATPPAAAPPPHAGPARRPPAVITLPPAPAAPPAAPPAAQPHAPARVPEAHLPPHPREAPHPREVPHPPPMAAPPPALPAVPHAPVPAAPPPRVEQHPAPAPPAHGAAPPVPAQPQQEPPPNAMPAPAHGRGARHGPPGDMPPPVPR